MASARIGSSSYLNELITAELKKSEPTRSEVTGVARTLGCSAGPESEARRDCRFRSADVGVPFVPIFPLDQPYETLMT